MWCITWDALIKKLNWYLLKMQNANNKTLKVKSLNGYDAIREKLEEGNTMTVKQPVITDKPKTKVSIGL